MFLVLLAGWSAGCGTGPVTASRPAGQWDRPVPDSEPRDVLALRLDLQPASDCDEQFDLELYRDRAVDLVTWDERRGACHGRVVSIRYLSQQTSKETLLGKVQQLAVNAELCTTETCSP